MKRIILFLVILMTLCKTPVVAQANDDTTGTGVTTAQFEDALINVTDTYTVYATTVVNIRKEPNTDSEILDKSNVNTSFEAVMEIGGWTMIVVDEGHAYMKSKYLSDQEAQYVYLGEFKITHYCCEKYKHICGTGTGLTKTGKRVMPGMIAVDPYVIPLGSIIMINGIEYTAEDTGGSIKGNKIDIAVPTHSEALELGTYRADVYIKK